MKILYVVTGLGVGGAERIVVDLADKANADGHEVMIAYLTGEVSVCPKSPQVFLFPLRMKGYFSFFFAFWKFADLVRKFRPDVVHSHMVHANLVARLIRLFISYPKLICSAHNSYEGGRFRMLAYRFTDRLCDVFTNVSEEAAAALEKLGAAPRGRIIPVLNGINVDRFKPFERVFNEEFVITAVGRLEAQKDYPNLLQAIALLERNHKKFRVRIIGGGALQAELVAFAGKLGLSSYIDWLGVRDDIPDILNESDIFVLASAWEGFGLVLAEAMACELPVVATDCGGVKEVLGDERWLTKPKDSAALSEKIITLMEMSRDERRQLGKRNRERVVAYYSLEKMYCNYKGLYFS